MRYTAHVDGRALRVEIDARGRLAVDGKTLEADAAELASGLVYSLLIDGRSHEIVVLERRPELRLRVDGRDVALALADEREEEATAGALGAGASFELRAPMPGLIVAVHVREGDVVDESASVCTLEAMKMENELTAPRRSRVARLAAAAGAKVNGGDLLAVLDPA